MIIRIVKMTFKPDKVADFLSVFNASKELIRNFEGCTHLQLMKDSNHDNIFFTYSHWQTEAHLNQYRQSALFLNTWAKTKILFDAKPEAWSLESVVEI